MPLIQNCLAGHRVVMDISEGAAIINGDEFIFTNAVEVKPGDVVIIDGNMAYSVDRSSVQALVSKAQVAQ